MPGKPAVFLDRDNTIIHNDGDLGDPTRVELIQGAAMAIASLCGLGFRTVVVTNQGGVARGKYGEADVDAVHDQLAELVAAAANGAHLDAFYFCPFHPKGTVPEFTREHEDRKPNPGMLLRAAQDHRLDLPMSWMVGDALRDVQAGRAAGCRTVWLCADDDALRQAAEANEHQRPDYVARNLVEAVRIIASQRHSRDEAKDKAMHAAQHGPPGKRFDADAMARLQRSTQTAPTHPPTQANANAYANAAAKPNPARPFRPYTLPPEHSDPNGPHTPATKTQPKAHETLHRFVEKVRTKVAPADAPADAPTTDEQPDKPTTAPAAAQTAAPAASQAETPNADAPNPSPQPTPDPNPTPPQPVDDTPELTKLARNILQELRGQRGQNPDAGPAGLFALVLQAIAAIALLAGLWMGADDDGLFLRWMGAALIAQLAVIALLIATRSSR